MKRLLAARDYDALQRALRTIDRDVPPHPKDRHNDDVQIYSLVSLLATLPWDTECFPVEIFTRERPDFLVICNGHSIGLEHTEAIHVNQAKERALRADGHGPDSYFPLRFRVTDKPLSSDEIIRLIESDDQDSGWVGDEVERNWSEAMAHFIIRKTASARKSGYALYGKNRLVIYDNWTAPALNHMRGLAQLREHLESNHDCWAVFDRIYIVDEQATIELSAKSYKLIHSVRHAI
jgi:hypothetical protein